MCDPVLGDNGALYVPESLIPIYQNEILPLSDICTPNQFEAELLTGIKIVSEEDAWKATEWFHSKGVKTVVLSSTNFASNKELISFLSHTNGELGTFFMNLPTKKLTLFVRMFFGFHIFSSQKITNFQQLLTNKGEERTRHTIPIPVVGDDIVFTGVGDLFAALFLAHSTTKSSLSEALEYTIATLQAVLNNTLQHIPKSESNKGIYV